MAAQTWTYIPSYSSAVEVEPRVRTAAFGDYEQRSPIGLRPVLQTWSLVYLHVDSIIAPLMTTFLNAETGSGRASVAEAILWTPPTESSARRFKITRYSKTHTDGNLVDFAIEFQEIIEP